jgi:hypothetical protein
VPFEFIEFIDEFVEAGAVELLVATGAVVRGSSSRENGLSEHPASVTAATIAVTRMHAVWL